MNEIENPRTHADKLKNDDSRAIAMRKKLRTGKADNKESAAEIKKKAALRERGRRKAYKNAVISETMRRQAGEANEDDNAGAEAMNAETKLTEEGIRHIRNSAIGEEEGICHFRNSVISEKEKNARYREKLHDSHQGETIRSGEAKRTANKNKDELIKGAQLKEASPDGRHKAQKDLMKKEIQANALRRRAKEEANSISSLTKRFTDKAEDITGRIAEAVTEFFEEHPLALIITIAVLLTVLVVTGTFGACGAMAGGSGDVVITTSFTAEEDDIRAVENDYKHLEDELQGTIDDIEADHPGYDEYRYFLDEIGHDPFELAALLTVLYEDYTEAEVQEMLKRIYELMYTLTLEEEVEIRTRTETRGRWVRKVDGTGAVYYEYETYEVEVEYEYHILNVTLTNNGMDAVISALGLTEDEILRYRILVETKGNKEDVFD